jgi:hypothetical protein
MRRWTEREPERQWMLLCLIAPLLSRSEWTSERGGFRFWFRLTDTTFNSSTSLTTKTASATSYGVRCWRQRRGRTQNQVMKRVTARTGICIIITACQNALQYMLVCFIKRMWECGGSICLSDRAEIKFRCTCWFCFNRFLPSGCWPRK